LGVEIQEDEKVAANFKMFYLFGFDRRLLYFLELSTAALDS